MHVSQVVKAGKLVMWQQLSQPCHDCQEQHVPRTCQQPGCDINKSVCNRSDPVTAVHAYAYATVGTWQIEKAEGLSTN